MTFPWIDHDVLAKDTVKEGVVFYILRSLLIKTLSSIYLCGSECHSAFHYQRAACIINIFGHKLGLLLSIFVDRVVIVRKTRFTTMAILG